MPAPSARVPLSDTSIAHEVFGHLWGLIFLGAMREAIPVPIPFGTALIEFVNDRSDEIDRIKALIQQALGLPPDAMTIFDDARRNLPGNVQTGNGVAAWLCLYTLNRAPIGLDLGDTARVRCAVQFGVQRQLYGLAEAMTLALAGRPPSRLHHVASAHRALTEAAALAGEPDPAATARQA